MNKLFDTLTIGQYQRVIALPKDLHPYVRGIHLYAIVTGKTLDEVRAMNKDDFEYELTDLSNIDPRPYEKARASRMMIGDKEFNIIADPAKLTAGQMIDCIEIARGDDPIEYMHYVLAAITTERIGSYSSADFEDRARAIQDTLLKDTWGVWVFFYNLWQHFWDVSEDYLIEEMEEAKKLLKELTRGGETG